MLRNSRLLTHASGCLERWCSSVGASGRSTSMFLPVHVLPLLRRARRAYLADVKQAGILKNVPDHVPL